MMFLSLQRGRKRLIAALAVGMTALGPGGAVAQTAGTATFDLFTEDGVDLNQDEARRLVDAARRAQAPGDCPLGRIAIQMPKGDPLFQGRRNGQQQNSFPRHRRRSAGGEA